MVLFAVKKWFLDSLASSFFFLPVDDIHFKSLNTNPTKWPHTHTQTIRRKIADELFECVWPFCKIGALRVKT